MEINKCFYCMQNMPSDAEVCPGCGKRAGEIPQPEFALPTGTILHGKYLIGAVLGQGGFGLTYIAYDLLLGIKVAVKEYYPAHSAARSRTGNVLWRTSGIPKEKGCENFLKEARKMARLMNIPEIVRVQDIIAENDTSYIVMEFVEGITLREKLKKEGVMSPQAVLSLLGPIAGALDRVHGYGIIHRDISTDNIMIDTDGRARLLDLGAAKEIDMHFDGDKQSSQMIHKDGFSPPEQYTCGGSIGAWTDVYALAATVYDCIMGRHVPSAMERFYSEAEIPFPAEIPENFRKALEKGLSLKAADRYRTVRQLWDALEAGGEPTTAAVTEPGPKTAAVTEPEPTTAAVTEPEPVTAAVTEPGPKTAAGTGTDAGTGHTPKKKKTGIFILAGVLVLGLVFAGIMIGFRLIPAKGDDSAELSSSAAASVSASEPVSEPTDTPVPTAAPASFNIDMLTVGETVFYGTYEQDNDTSDGAEPIEWRILDKEGDSILVISVYGLDVQPYNEEDAAVTWQTCTLRTWLNDDFYNTAFSEAEQAGIDTTRVVNDDNPDFGTEGGSDTTDKIFLLSMDEAEAYFADAQDRLCVPTAYAALSCADEAGGSDDCWWWLRAPGIYFDSLGGCAVNVVLDGSCSDNFWRISEAGCIRPALWINLGS